MRQNILNNKWFIKFTADGNSIEFAGQILGEASDGWFYVAITNTGLSVISRQVVAIGELESARFYNSDSDMITVCRKFDKPMLKRKGESDES